MLRRCIESNNPRFGMILPLRGDGPEYGTMLEIRSIQTLQDGRSMVETVGSWRFKVLEKGGIDGYTVGRVERLVLPLVHPLLISLPLMLTVRMRLSL
jgi:Lon protease-like protein